MVKKNIYITRNNRSLVRGIFICVYEDGLGKKRKENLST